MKKELKAYIERVAAQIDSGEGIDLLLEDMKINISFFQHERLVHLIVTMTFALLAMLSLALFAVTAGLYFLPLFILFLALEIPYVFHYYSLENGVQKLQRLYRKALELSRAAGK